jgi:hypothetical protein
MGVQILSISCLFPHAEKEKRLQTPEKDAKLEDRMLTEPQTRLTVWDDRAI